MIHWLRLNDGELENKPFGPNCGLSKKMNFNHLRCQMVCLSGRLLVGSACGDSGLGRWEILWMALFDNGGVARTS